MFLLLTDQELGLQWLYRDPHIAVELRRQRQEESQGGPPPPTRLKQASTADKIIAVVIVVRSVHHPNSLSYYQLPNSGLVCCFLLT